MIRPLRTLASLMAACALAACATVGPHTSYVALQQAADEQVLAFGIASFVKSQFWATTTVVLDPTPTDQQANALTPALADSLRRQGFALAEEVAPGAHTLRYLVTPLDTSGELVRLTIDDRVEASRFFVRNNAGVLQAGGPFTVAQMDAAP